MNSPIQKIGTFTRGYEVQVGSVQQNGAVEYKGSQDLRRLLSDLQSEATKKYGNANLEFRLRTSDSGRVYLQLRKQTLFGKLKPMSTAERARRNDDRKSAIEALSKANLYGVNWPNSVGGRKEARQLAAQIREALSPQRLADQQQAIAQQDAARAASLNEQEEKATLAMLDNLKALVDSDLGRQERLFNKAELVRIQGNPGVDLRAELKPESSNPVGSHDLIAVDGENNRYKANERGELIPVQRMPLQREYAGDAAKAVVGDMAAQRDLNLAVAERDARLGVFYRNLTGYLRPYEPKGPPGAGVIQLPDLPIDPRNPPGGLGARKELEDLRHAAEKTINDGAAKVTHLMAEGNHAEAFELLKTEQEPDERKALNSLIKGARELAARMRADKSAPDGTSIYTPQVVATLAEMMVCEYSFMLSRYKSNLADPSQRMRVSELAPQDPAAVEKQVQEALETRTAPALVIHRRLQEELQRKLTEAAGSDPALQAQAKAVVDRTHTVQSQMLKTEQRFNLIMSEDGAGWRRPPPAREDAAPPYKSWVDSAKIHNKTYEEAQQRIRNFEALKATFKVEKSKGFAGIGAKVMLKPNLEAVEFNQPQMMQEVQRLERDGKLNWNQEILDRKVDQEKAIKLLKQLPRSDGLGVVQNTLEVLDSIQRTRHWSAQRALGFLDDAQRRLLAPFVPGGLTIKQMRDLNPAQLDALIDPPRNLDPDRPAPPFATASGGSKRGLLAAAQASAQLHREMSSRQEVDPVRAGMPPNNTLNKEQLIERQTLQAKPLESRRFALELLRLIQLEHAFALQPAHTSTHLKQTQDAVNTQIASLEAFVRTLPDDDAQAVALNKFLVEVGNRVKEAIKNAEGKLENDRSQWGLGALAAYGKVSKVKQQPFSVDTGLAQLASLEHDQAELGQQWLAHFESAPATAAADALRFVAQVQRLSPPQLAALPTEILSLAIDLRGVYDPQALPGPALALRSEIEKRQRAAAAAGAAQASSAAAAGLAPGRAPTLAEWRAAIGPDARCDIEPEGLPWKGTTLDWALKMEKLVNERYKPMVEQGRLAPALLPPPTLMTLELPPSTDGQPRWATGLLNWDITGREPIAELQLMLPQTMTLDEGNALRDDLTGNTTRLALPLRVQTLSAPTSTQAALTGEFLKRLLSDRPDAVSLKQRLTRMQAQDQEAPQDAPMLRRLVANARMTGARAPAPMGGQRLLQQQESALLERWFDLHMLTSPTISQQQTTLDLAALAPLDRFIEDLSRAGVNSHHTLGMALLTRAQLKLRMKEELLGNQVMFHEIRTDAVRGRQMVEQAIRDAKKAPGPDIATTELIKGLSKDLESALKDIGEMARIQLRTNPTRAAAMQPDRLDSLAQTEARAQWTQEAQALLAPFDQWEQQTREQRLQADGNRSAERPQPTRQALQAVRDMQTRLAELSRKYSPATLAAGNAAEEDLAALAELKLRLGQAVFGKVLNDSKAAEDWCNDALNDLDAAAEHAKGDIWRDEQPLWQRRHEMAREMRTASIFVRRARIESDQSKDDAKAAYRAVFGTSLPNPFEQATKLLDPAEGQAPNGHALGDALHMARERCKKTLLDDAQRREVEQKISAGEINLTADHLYTLRALEQNHRDTFEAKLKKADPAFNGEVLLSQATVDGRTRNQKVLVTLETKAVEVVRQRGLDRVDAGLDAGDLAAQAHEALQGRPLATLLEEIRTGRLDQKECLERASMLRRLGLMMHDALAADERSALRRGSSLSDAEIRGRLDTANQMLKDAQTLLQALRDGRWTPSASATKAVSDLRDLIDPALSAPRDAADVWFNSRARNAGKAQPDEPRKLRESQMQGIKQMLPAYEERLNQLFEGFEEARRTLRRREAQPPFALRARRLGNSLEMAEKALASIREFIDGMPQNTPDEKERHKRALDQFRSLDLGFVKGPLTAAHPNHGLTLVRFGDSKDKAAFKGWEKSLQAMRTTHFKDLQNADLAKIDLESMLEAPLNEQRRLRDEIQANGRAKLEYNRTGALPRDAVQGQLLALEIEIQRAKWYAQAADQLRVFGTEAKDVALGAQRHAARVLMGEALGITAAVRGNREPILTAEQAFDGAKRYKLQTEKRLKDLEASEWLSDADQATLRALRSEWSEVPNQA